MSNPWLPTGKLSDGTLVFGPLRERPTDFGSPIAEVQIAGVTWFVGHSGAALSPATRPELESWVRQRVSELNTNTS